MSASTPLNLLLIHDFVDEANKLVSLFRNASYQVSAKHITSEQELPKVLQDGAWDLIVAQLENKTVPPQTIFHTTRRLSRDLPTIFISENADSARIECLRMGASDVISVDNDQHLLLAVARTLYNLEQRRQLRYWKRRYVTAESRGQTLMDSSRHAIALVKEGTYIYANESFAQLFGYQDSDDMICLPVIDSVAEASRNQIKSLLKNMFEENSWDSQEVHFSGQRADDLPIEVTMTATQVVYEDEPALQFMIKADEQASEPVVTAGGIASTPSSGLTEIRLNKLIENVNGAIHRAAQQHKDSVLICIQLDQFERLRTESNMATTEELMHQVARIIENQITDEHFTGRFQEDTFLLLLPNTDPDSALSQCEALCKKVASEIINVESQTFAVTLSIGLSVISEAVTTFEVAIERCMQAMEKLHKESDTSGVGNGAKLYEMEFTRNANQIDNNVESLGRKLLGNDQLELLYQPIISLHGDNLPIYEVLIQVKDQEIAEELPSDFISQVFKTDAAKEIDHWIIHEAILALTEIHERDPNVRLFINISQSTFCDPEFIQWLKINLSPSGISPKSLIFQLREIDVGRYLNQGVETIELLTEMGSEVALAHFGMSINPMQLLERVSVNYVKLDRLLVEKAHDDQEGVKALESLLAKMTDRNEKVIVPFIESPAMMPTLWRMGVKFIQGHYLQPPQPSMSFDFSGDDD
ncbi:EAL domain-containing protein [Porticoccaceae bacterium LTM1]|nr:EAL domain-containing protein [Porticoccaceae bacterium LTM1]